MEKIKTIKFGNFIHKIIKGEVDADTPFIMVDKVFVRYTPPTKKHPKGAICILAGDYIRFICVNDYLKTHHPTTYYNLTAEIVVDIIWKSFNETSFKEVDHLGNLYITPYDMPTSNRLLLRIYISNNYPKGTVVKINHKTFEVQTVTYSLKENYVKNAYFANDYGTSRKTIQVLDVHGKFLKIVSKSNNDIINTDEEEKGELFPIY